MLEPGSWELTIYEKNPSVGGTWFENRYVMVELYHIFPNENHASDWIEGILESLATLLQVYTRFRGIRSKWPLSYY
jgi:cation diffusion facilitator CzcD-associated flavoprotein CzcO